MGVIEEVEEIINNSEIIKWIKTYKDRIYYKTMVIGSPVFILIEKTLNYHTYPRKHFTDESELINCINITFYSKKLETIDISKLSYMFGPKFKLIIAGQESAEIDLNHESVKLLTKILNDAFNII